MNELLAFAALHMSLVRPMQREHYHQEATQLQTHAIRLFNSVNLDINTDNCVPTFLFPSILGTHMLYETLRFREGDLGAFVARFMQYTLLTESDYLIFRSTYFC